MPEFAVLTLSTGNYLHWALALARSVREHNPGVPVHVGLIDRPAPSPRLPEEEGLHFFHTDELPVPAWRRFAFQYPPVALACSLKGFALEMLLSGPGPGKVLYLDADTHVYGPLEPVARKLDDFDLVLTPHVSAAGRSGGGDRQELFLRSFGIYNAGFLGLRRGPAALAMLRWWQDKMLKGCVIDLPRQTYLDQTWLDLVPALFPNVHVERGAGYNVGFWNVRHRPVTRAPEGRFLAGGEALVLFHFSGFDPHNPARLSSRTAAVDPSFDEASQDGLPPLLADYSARLRACGLATYSRLPYGFAALRDGTPIREAWREMIRTDFPPLAGVADPFDTGAAPDLDRRFAEAEREFASSPQTSPAARLRQLEGLYQSLDNSPLLGPLLRRYEVFRAARKP